MNPSYDNNFGSLNPGGLTQPGNSPEPLTPQSFRPVSSGQGDIILASQSQKRSKKWLVIVAAIIILLVIVAIVVVLLYNNRLQDDEKGVHESFYRLSNYVVKGNTSTEATVFPENYNDFYFTAQLYADDRRELLINTKDLVDKFSNEYNKYINENNSKQYPELLKSYIDTEKKLIEFMNTVYVKDRPSLSDILKEYKSGRIDDLLEYMDNYYAFTNIDSNEYMSGYHDALTEWSDYLLQIIKKYDESGCIVDNNLLYECMQEKNNDSLLYELSNLESLLGSTIQDLDYYHNLSYNFISLILKIDNGLNGEVDLTSSLNLEERDGAQ